MDETSKRHGFMSTRVGKFLAALTSTALLMTGFASGTPALAQGGGSNLQPLTVNVVRTDTTATPGLGDELSFDIRVTNPNAQVIKVIPVEINIPGIFPKCRWRTFPASQTQTCRGVKYTVTNADVAAREYIPKVKFNIASDDAGQNVLLEGAPVNGPRVPIAQTTPPPPAPANPFTITWTRSDNLGTDVREGDVLRWTINVRSNLNQPVAAVPSDSNLTGALPSSVPNCRYSNLNANGQFDCTSLSHLVSAADVALGTFTPYIQIDAKTHLTGNAIIAPGERSNGDPVTLSTGKRVDPATVPTDRQPGEHVTLAEQGRGDYDCYRIPALTTAKNGWILAAWDGRPGGCADVPNPNSVEQRISKDGGKSWEAAKTVAAGTIGNEDTKIGYSDPSYVVDRTSGHIFMFFVKSFKKGFHGSHPGTDPNNRNIVHAAYIKSTDNGESWSAPVVITDAITNAATWTSRFAASGEGIQKQYAPHKGRLIQQFTIKNGGEDAAHFQAVSVYSDDGGATWKAGQSFGTFMDENKVVELENGDLMVNSRTSKGGETLRRIAISKDGGETYGDVTLDSQLIDPRNNASIIRAFPDAAPGTPDAKILLFTNAKNPGARANGHVWVSFDNGKTWPWSKAFDTGGMAYSTITHLRDANGKVIPGQYGLLYEKPYNQIRYMPISWDWLGAARVVVSGVEREAQRGVLKFQFTVTNNEPAPLRGANLVPEPKHGWEWKTPVVPLPEVAPTNTVTVEAVAKVGNEQNAGPTQVIASVITADQKGSYGGFNVTFKLVQGQKHNGCMPDGVRVVNGAQLPSQAGEGPERLVDNNPSTLWHTPYGERITRPLAVDFGFDYEEGIRRLYLVPREQGENGKIHTASLYVLKNGVEVELLPETDLSGLPLMDLAGLAQHATIGQPVVLRVKIHSTKGAEVNKWASLGELCVDRVDPSVPTYDETATTPPTPPVPPVPPAPPVRPITPGPVNPAPGDDTTRPGGALTVNRLSGESRVETAVSLSQADFPKGAEVIVLARSDVHADSVSGVALADALKAPVLLTLPESLHGETAKEIKRLQPKGGRVIIMGGEVAISRGVEEALVKLGAKPERVAGPNRAATAVATAKVLAQLNKATQVLVADGAGWEASLIAGPVAASVDGVTLLTNGDKMAPETAAYLKEAKVPLTTIGAKAKAALPGQKAIEGADASALSVNVAKAFFSEAKAVGVATTATFADALTGGVHIGRKHGPLLLVPTTTPASVTDWVKGERALTHLYIYGGPTRISEAQAQGLSQ